MYPHLKKLIPIAGSMLLLVMGCRKQDQSFSPSQSITAAPSKTPAGLGKFDSYILQSWYQLALQLTKETPGHTPPVAARNFAYMGVAAYEALVGEMSGHRSLAGQLNGLHSVPQRQYGHSYLAPVTANAALARITRQLFQNATVVNLGKIDELENAVSRIVFLPIEITLSNQQVHVIDITVTQIVQYNTSRCFKDHGVKLH